MTDQGASPSGPGSRASHEAAGASSPKASIPDAGPRQITVAEFHAELAAQGVGHRDYAFRCVSCGTIQSMNSLVAAGVPKDKVDRYVAFSCEGRWNKQRGCDWTLGGLFTIHKLEVVTHDGERHPRFEPATPAEAKALAQGVEARSDETAQQAQPEGRERGPKDAPEPPEGDGHG